MITQYGLRCRGCGDEIYSNHRHDFVACKCDGIFIDGGFDYHRYGFNDKVGPGEPIERQLTQRPRTSFRKERKRG